MPVDLTARALRDPVLPLAEALDPRLMAEPLARAAGSPTPRRDVHAVVLNHKARRRCTISYAAGGTRLVGKLYARPVLAGRAHAWIEAVQAATAVPGDAAVVPAPRAVLPELGLALHAHAPGTQLGHALCATAVAAAGRWLWRLHATAPPPGVKAEPLTHELVRLDWWCADARPSLRRRAARTLDDAYERLRALAATLPGRPAVLVHRDFYEENLLWDDRRLWVLDFDQLARGDPALDVAHFQARLEALAYRRTGRAEAYAALVARFTQAAPPVDANRLRFYRAQTFVKIAATEVQRRRDGWRELAEAFTELALRETERRAPPAPAQASTPTSRSRGARGGAR